MGDRVFLWREKQSRNKNFKLFQCFVFQSVCVFDIMTPYTTFQLEFYSLSLPGKPANVFVDLSCTPLIFVQLNVLWNVYAPPRKCLPLKDQLQSLFICVEVGGVCDCVWNFFRAFHCLGVDYINHWCLQVTASPWTALDTDVMTQTRHLGSRIKVVLVEMENLHNWKKPFNLLQI